MSGTNIRPGSGERDEDVAATPSREPTPEQEQAFRDVLDGRREVHVVRGEEPGVPEDFDVVETLRAADEAASVAHDFIHGLNGVTREQASDAVWTIHNNLRPLFEEADLGY